MSKKNTNLLEQMKADSKAAYAEPEPERSSVPVHAGGSKAVAVPVDNFDRDLDDNMEGVEPRLPQVGIVHAGQLFKMPDGTKADALEGIIVDSNRTNAYWATALSKGGVGNPPDCFSFNGIVPHADEPKAPNCAGCRLNQYGSKVEDNGGAGRGKACKNNRRIHVLVNGNRIPFRLTIPSSSLRAWDDYMVALTNKGWPYKYVVTHFGLEKANNKDGIEFSRCTFELVNTIEDAAKRAEIKDLRDRFLGTMRHQEIIDTESEAAKDGDPFGDDIPEPGARG